ncbi:hypothetical protein B0I37DRAFT_353739 [Chaetomium sp. MPI-CAGE-AT-0009]|nr:hypothetical protein B0I37DRAFT_353739 [Chaetomium sp. MPI-CAGE-AT-0009]
MCPVCLDLDHDKFAATPGLHGEDQSLELSPLPRYRIVSRHEVAAAADGGCKLCSILREGMLHLWGDQAPQHVDPHRYGIDSDDESDDEGNCGVKKAACVDEDEIRRLHHNICIELRPERTLAVTWLGTLFMSYYIFGGIQPRLEFYVDARNPRPAICNAFGRAPGVTKDIDVESATSMLTRWLDDCKNHLACSGQPAKLPRRLLDLSRAGLPRLVETDTIETTSILPRYTTLSYCWGVLGATHLRFDDEQDWIEQSAVMADVYSLSYLTIAAVAATNPSASLFGERQAFTGRFYPHSRLSIRDVADFRPLTTHAIDPPSATSAPVHVRYSHSHIHGCVLASGGQRWSAATPLLGRAWVFQERLLSYRIVFFTGSEMLWQCQECFRCECGDMDSFSAVLPRMQQARAEYKVPRPLNWGPEDRFMGRIQQALAQLASGRCSAEQAHHFWPDVVKQYSNLALTQESDRPYAIAGIARRIQEATGDTYLAGLWREDLPQGLLWVGLPLWSTKARRRPRIPSWSWMSRYAPEARGRPWTLNNRTENFRTDSRLRVVVEETFCSKKKGDEFGAVVDGQVQLEAAMRHAVITKSNEANEGHFLLRFGDEDCDDLLEQTVDLDCAFDETEPVRPGDVVYCVLLGTDIDNSGWGQQEKGQSLVLREVEGREGVYRRVGVSSHPPDLFVEAPVAVVKII